MQTNVLIKEECIWKNKNKLCPYEKLSVFYNICLKTFRSHLVCNASFFYPRQKIFRDITSMLRVRVYCLSPLVFLSEFAKLLKATISFIILSVPLSAWNNSAAIERVIMKFDIGKLFENLSKMFKFQ